MRQELDKKNRDLKLNKVYIKNVEETAAFSSGFHSSALLPFFPPVCAGGGMFGVFGYWLQAHCRLCLEPGNCFPASLMLLSVLIASCSSTTRCRMSSTWAHPLQAGLCLSLPGRRVWVLPAAWILHCSLSLQQLHLRGGISHHQGDGAASPPGAAAFALRRVPPACLNGQVGWAPLMVTEWCPADGLYGLQVPPLSQHNAPPLKRHPPAPTAVPGPGCLCWSWCSWLQSSWGWLCRTEAWPLLTPGPAYHSSATLVWAARSWCVSVLSVGFPGSGYPLCAATIHSAVNTPELELITPMSNCSNGYTAFKSVAVTPGPAHISSAAQWTDHVLRKPIITSQPKISSNNKWLTANRERSLHTLWFSFSFVDYSLLSIIYSFSFFEVGKKVVVSFFPSELSVFSRALSTQGI